jgi:hypothetical protein
VVVIIVDISTYNVNDPPFSFWFKIILAGV